MKIRTKLIFNYSILTLILLLLFSFIVVFAYIRYRQHDFGVRIQNRATSTANLLLNVGNIDSLMLGSIDRNIITAMGDLQISILSANNKLIYTNSFLNKKNGIHLKNDSTIGFLNSLSLGHKTILFKHLYSGHSYYIEASAIDNIGINELKSLLRIIMWVLVISLIFIVGFGFYNAVWSLKPFKDVIKEVENLEPTFIHKRMTIKGNDEVSQLAKSFNKLLDQIEQSFETEKSFISNASHELRTPITSVLGQIEVVLNKSRTQDEYKALLHSVYEDTMQMATIINGFLELAQTNLNSNLPVMNNLRIDELLFTIIEDFEKRKPYYNVSLDFISNPESSSQLEYFGNDKLLRLLFNNLIDNGCKYSEDKKTKITIDLTDGAIRIAIIDFGIGIPEEDMANIFKPLFRGKNTSGKPGHGIGLAIVKRIADLHNITLDIKSELNYGTTIYVGLISK